MHPVAQAWLPVKYLLSPSFSVRKPTFCSGLGCNVLSEVGPLPQNHGITMLA